MYLLVVFFHAVYPISSICPVIPLLDEVRSINNPNEDKLNPEDTVHELLYDFLPTGAKHCALILSDGDDAGVRCGSLAVALQFTFDERLHNLTYPPLSLITFEWCEANITPLVGLPFTTLDETRLSHNNWRLYEEAVANKTDLDIANDLKWELQEEQFVMQVYFFIFNPVGPLSMHPYNLKLDHAHHCTLRRRFQSDTKLERRIQWELRLLPTIE